MAEVGVERFRAGDGEKHGAERVKPDDAVVKQETDAVPRVECEQHGQILSDVPDARGCDGANQNNVTGPKNAATLAVPRDCTANRMTRTSTVSGTT